MKNNYLYLSFRCLFYSTPAIPTNSVIRVTINIIIIIVHTTHTSISQLQSLLYNEGFEELMLIFLMGGEIDEIDIDNNSQFDTDDIVEYFEYFAILSIYSQYIFNFSEHY